MKIQPNTQPAPRFAHLRETARRSYNWISQSPDRRGDSVINDYSAELDSDIETLTAQAITEEARAALPAAIDRYKSKYESLFVTWLHSQGNTASTFVTGGSNFPVRRQEKLHRWADNHYNSFREWRTKALKAITRDLQGPTDELAINRKKLADAEKLQVIMVQANKIIRKGENVIPKLAEIGVSATQAAKLVMPDFASRSGFAPYMMQNNNARIKQYKARLAVLESKQASESNANDEIPFRGGKVVLNYQLDRLQIIHEAKPEPAVLSILKQNAFRWSPFNKAWQRQLTDNAKHAASKITGVQLLNKAA